MKYMRICIETLLPKSQRPAPDITLTHLVAVQHPVSGWMEVIEWWAVREAVAATRPVHLVGLLIGSQEKEDDKPYPLEGRLAEIHARDTKAAWDEWAKRRDIDFAAKVADVERRIDEFVTGFNFAAYWLESGWIEAGQA